MRYQGRYMIGAGSPPSADEEFLLEGSEAHHLLTVRRAQPGDILELSDGRGNAWRAEFLGADEKMARCAVREKIPCPPGPGWRLTLATAVPRPKRMTFLVEKCAELGVSELIPVKWKHSTRLGKDAAVERWRRLTESAAKQSRQDLLMQVCEPLEAQSLPALLTDFDRVLILDTGGGETPRRALDGLQPGSRILALVGPEGGFEPSELESLHRDAGELCRSVSLGPAILRVETACITLAGAIMLAALDSEKET